MRGIHITAESKLNDRPDDTHTFTLPFIPPHLHPPPPLQQSPHPILTTPKPTPTPSPIIYLTCILISNPCSNNCPSSHNPPSANIPRRSPRKWRPASCSTRKSSTSLCPSLSRPKNYKGRPWWLEKNSCRCLSNYRGSNSRTGNSRPLGLSANRIPTVSELLACSCLFLNRT